MSDMKCSICKIDLDDYTAYEYRGQIACADHHDEMIEARDYQRSQIIKEENDKLEPLKGLDLSDSAVGKENRKILAGRIEIASKESLRLKQYEGRD